MSRTEYYKACFLLNAAELGVRITKWASRNLLRIDQFSEDWEPLSNFSGWSDAVVGGLKINLRNFQNKFTNEETP